MSAHVHIPIWGEGGLREGGGGRFAFPGTFLTTFLHLRKDVTFWGSARMDLQWFFFCCSAIFPSAI